MFNDDQPSILSAVPRIVCIGDVHGDLSRLIEILKIVHIIDNNMKWIAVPNNTIVVQLGDQLDSMSRGTAKTWEVIPDTDVVKFMDNLDKIARKSGGRVLSILGNHELMNIMGDYSYVSQNSMTLSGGVVKREHMFRNGGYMAQMLSKRNIVVKIGDISFCHGGILPQHLDVVGDNCSIINRVARKYLRAEKLNGYEEIVFHQTIVGSDSILWTRKYFELIASGNQEELGKLINEVNRRLGSVSIAVGHNTVNNITPSVGGALWLVDAALSRSYDSTYNEILEILYNDDPTKQTEFRVIHIDKDK
jgi:hypothetical protein